MRIMSQKNHLHGSAYNWPIVLEIKPLREKDKNYVRIYDFRQQISLFRYADNVTKNRLHGSAYK